MTKKRVPPSHKASPSDLGWSLGSLSSSSDLSLDPVCLVSDLLAPTGPSGFSPSPIKQPVLALARDFLCLASAILPCLLLSIGVPALSGPELVTVSQPRSWSLKHVCHAGGTSPMGVRIQETFCLSCLSAPGVESVLFQFRCCVGLFICLFPSSGKDTSVQSDPGKHRPRLPQEPWAGPLVSGLAGLMLMLVQAMNVQLTLRQSGSCTRQPPR